MKDYANDLGIKIFGDLPVYVSKESSDMWQNPDMFVVNEDLSPKLVAGVPPDRFSETGQYWGNPVYDDVINLRDRFSFKGMKVMQFAFDLNEESDYLPHNVGETTVYYTGTHDNQTLRGFVNSRSSDELEYIKNYVNSDDVQEALIKVAYMTRADLCMCQMQDFLDLDDDYRTNTPNTLGNWTWRMKKDWLTDELECKISSIVKLYNRD